MASEKTRAIVEGARAAAVEAIVEMMEKGGIRWFESWDSSAFQPHNGITGKGYRGGNRIHLVAVAYMKGYADNRWYTFNQARKAGFHVKKGEKSAIVEYWKLVNGMKDAHGNWTDDAELAEKVVRFPKLCGVFHVFNAEQLADADGNPPSAEEAVKLVDCDSEMGAMADTLIRSSRCRVIEGNQISQACYSPVGDTVKMPSREAFTSMEAFLTVLTHEMTHSTALPLGREEGTGNVFGSEAYAFEELIAELGSTFTCLELGVHRSAELESDVNFQNHAAYLQSWMMALQNDPDCLFRAAAKADSAADYILERYRAEDGRCSGDMPAA